MEPSQPANTEPKAISYPEAFFYDVTNQVRITDESDEMRHNVEVVYNSFKDKIHMDTESKISITRENMLALEYFQLFMLVMHEMNFFWRVRMAEDDTGPEQVTFVFNQILTEFCRFACHIRNYPNDASTWDEMEVSLHDIQNKVSELHYAVGSYLYEDDAKTNSNQKIVMNKDGTPFIMPSDDETEDQEPKTDEEKFEEQKLFQAMEISRMNWAVERIMIVVHTTVNICVAVVFAFMFARIWCFLGSIEGKDKYKLDDGELGGIFLALTIIIILNNIKTINKWIKELVNNG